MALNLIIVESTTVSKFVNKLRFSHGQNKQIIKLNNLCLILVIMSNVNGEEMSTQTTLPVEQNHLRHTLNVNCLLEVLEYLHVLDLIQLCELDTEMDAFYTSLIKDHIIGKKLIDLEPRYRKQIIWPLTKTLETFGPNVKRLKIPMRPSHFNYILRRIITHCLPDTITECQFKMFYYDSEQKETDMNRDLLHQAVPYLRSVERLLFDGDWMDHMDLFPIFLNSGHLKSLTIVNIRIYSLDLVTVQTLNLIELHAVDSTLFGHDMGNFIQRLPLLEVFIWEGRSNPIGVLDALSKHCPKLRIYGNFVEKREPTPRYYDSIERFNHLTEVSLTSNQSDANDIQFALQSLAKKNRLQKLVIYQTRMDIIQSTLGHFEYFNGFASLSHIVFRLPEYSDGANCAEREQFYRNIMTSMHTIRKITLIGKAYVSKSSIIIQYAPLVQEIDIHQQTLYHMPAEIRHIRKAIQIILEQRRTNGNEEKIHLIVNTEQKREFAVLKGIEQLVTISTKNQSEERKHTTHISLH